MPIVQESHGAQDGKDGVECWRTVLGMFVICYDEMQGNTPACVILFTPWFPDAPDATFEVLVRFGMRKLYAQSQLEFYKDSELPVRGVRITNGYAASTLARRVS